MMVPTKDKRKQSIYFPDAMLVDIRAEAERTDRSISWLLQFAWRHSREARARIPTMTEVSG
jgi:uncharacterized small protein (TIGR04563 family)